LANALRRRTVMALMIVLLGRRSVTKGKEPTNVLIPFLR
jgi:hypothetical protein